MPAVGVVEISDPGGDLGLGFLTGLKPLAVDVFGFDGGGECFGGVIQCRAQSGHGLRCPENTIGGLEGLSIVFAVLVRGEVHPVVVSAWGGRGYL